MNFFTKWLDERRQKRALGLRKLALKIAFAYLGKWYKWGGDDPSGFDCSGFIMEILQSVGLVNRKEDLTAQGLWDRFLPTKISQPKPGALVFWQNDKGKVIHVEMCLDWEVAIGASGGYGKTLTVEDAMKHNAFIKIRPIYSKKGIKGFLDPFCMKSQVNEDD
jgi:hypothetical protein